MPKPKEDIKSRTNMYCTEKRAIAFQKIIEAANVIVLKSEVHWLLGHTQEINEYEIG